MKDGKETWVLTFMSLMLGVTIVFTTLESMLPPLPLAPPGIRLGLANVATMYVLFFVGKKQALTLIILKTTFVILTRGAIAGLLSAAGGVLSILAMILLMSISKKASFILLSSAGAIAFNIGQIAAASLITRTNLLLLYWPLILIFGVMLGSITGKILEIVIPYLERTG